VSAMADGLVPDGRCGLLGHGQRRGGLVSMAEQDRYGMRSSKITL
jgi:hypothetical protein